jgi:hypothetical protein
MAFPLAQHVDTKNSHNHLYQHKPSQNAFHENLRFAKYYKKLVHFAANSL